VRHRRMTSEAGVFGVTSVLLPDGDLYWGREHFPTLTEMLRAKR
jgi:2-hydroxychromene-2-carboxylate isomerase